MLVVTGILFFVIPGCDTTKNVYRSAGSKTDYIKIKAVTLTHCGCTELFADNYKNDQLESQIFYSNQGARKTLFNYKLDAKMPLTTYFNAIQDNTFTVPFSETDAKIFSVLDSLIANKVGIIYPVRRVVYRGFIADTVVRR